MKTIKNSEELAKLVNEKKDLFLKGEDVRIEYQFTREELCDVYCRDLFLMNDDKKFDFNGGNFNGGDFNGGNFNGGNFNGGNFNGWNFNGWNFNGGDFNGGDFNGGNFNGKKVFYHAFFNCRGGIKCVSIEGSRKPYSEPVCLDGKLEIIKETNSLSGKTVKVEVDGIGYEAIIK